MRGRAAVILASRSAVAKISTAQPGPLVRLFSAGVPTRADAVEPTRPTRPIRPVKASASAQQPGRYERPPADTRSEFGDIPMGRRRERFLTGTTPEAQLKSLYGRPSSSSQPPKVWIHDLLRILQPVLQSKDMAVLDPYLFEIARTLSRLNSKMDISPDDTLTVNDTLLYCFTRANAVRTAEGWQVIDIARSLAQGLVASTALLDRQALTDLLYRLQSALQRYRDTTGSYQLPKHLFAAWAVLRDACPSVPSTPVRFVPPTREETISALRSLCGEAQLDVSAFEDYIPALDELERQCKELDLRSVHGPAQVDATLAALRVRKETTEAIELWTTFRDRYIDRPSPADQLPAEDKSKYLAAFFRFFCRGAPVRNKRYDFDLAQYERQVLDRMSRPYPREVYYTLLTNRAWSEEAAVVESSAVRELGADQPTEREMAAAENAAAAMSDPNRRQRDLEAVWKLTEEDRVRDVKMYMIYMEGVAKMGNIDALCRTWGELVKLQQEGNKLDQGDANLDPGQDPLTRLLNHMLSCALVIPSAGPQVAAELFEQVTKPTSAITPDIITFNTMLRHYARSADVEAMSALLPMAEQHGTKPDVVTYTTLIQGLFAARKVDMAHRAFQAMLAQNLRPNERTMSLLVHELARPGDRWGMSAAEGLLKEMRRQRLRVGEATWTSLISGYISGGWGQEAWATVKRMEDSGMRLNAVGYNILLRAAGSQHHDTFQELASAERAERVRRGQEVQAELRTRPRPVVMEVFDRMLRDKVEPNSDTYVIVLGILHKRRLWPEADEVVDIMKKRGFVPMKSALQSVIAKVQAREGDQSHRTSRRYISR